MSLFILNKNSNHKKAWQSPKKDILYSFREKESEIAAKIIIYEIYNTIVKRNASKWLKKKKWKIINNNT